MTAMVGSRPYRAAILAGVLCAAVAGCNGVEPVDAGVLADAGARTDAGHDPATDASTEPDGGTGDGAIHDADAGTAADAGTRTLEAWARSYEHIEQALAVLPVAGGTVIVGEPYRAPRELAVARTDLDGNLLWARRYQGLDPRDATIDAAGHVAVLGETTNRSIGLVTIDGSDGALLAQRTYASGSLVLSPYDLLALPDGALAFTTGRGLSADAEGVGLHVVTEPDGTIRWARRYAFRDLTSGQIYGSPVLRRFGATGLAVTNNFHVYTLDGEGDVDLAPRWTGCLRLVAMPAGGFACVAFRREDLGSSTLLQRTLHLVRLDESLSVSWVRGHSLMYFSSTLAPLFMVGGLAATADGEFLVSLNASTTDTSAASLALIRFDAGGDLLWAHTYVHGPPHVAGPAPDPYGGERNDGLGLDVAEDGRIRMLAFLHGGNPNVVPERSWVLDLPASGSITFSSASAAVFSELPVSPDPSVTTVPAAFVDHTFEELPAPALAESALTVSSEPFTTIVVATDAP